MLFCISVRLLIITQNADRTDPILGFFHRWIEEFAKHASSVTVIGQQVGSHEFSEKVTVLSLEKEKGRSKWSQVIRFWKLILLHKQSYDCVLVHMTPIWIILGAPFWLLLRKKMYLWYEIKRGGLKLKLALLFVHKVFAATEHGLPFVSKKQVITGHGIDCEEFTPDPERCEPGHIVSVGRVTRVKDYKLLITALAELGDCRLTIAGGTITDDDKHYAEELSTLMHRLGIADRVEVGWVAPEQACDLFQRTHVFVHAARGGLDKAVLQAMACGVPVVSTSEAAASVLPEECVAGADSLVEKIDAFLGYSQEERLQLGSELRKIVEKDHEVRRCVERLVKEMCK